MAGTADHGSNHPGGIVLDRSRDSKVNIACLRDIGLGEGRDGLLTWFSNAGTINSKSHEYLMQTRRFGRKLKLPSTIAIKHQIRKSMLEDALKQEAAERANATAPQPEERPPVLSS